MISDLVSLRLQNQHLSCPDFELPEDVVAHLGAVQAQDFNTAMWSIGLRMRQSTAGDVETAFSEGKFLRIHVLRPTWHFVMPANIRWMVRLTASRVKKSLAPYDSRLEISPSFLSQCHRLIGRALEGNHYLSRTELGQYLNRHGIEARGQRLGHIMAYAELDGLVCGGPRQGKQTTYALLEERVPPVAALTREQALAKLAKKYFTSHGPAQLKDFAWWGGLSMKDAAEGFESVKPDLESSMVGDKTYHFKPAGTTIDAKSPSAFFLSIYDEYTIAYKDRTDISEGRQQDIETMLAMGNALTAVVVLNGKVAGTWKRILTKGCAEIKLSLFRPLLTAEKASLQVAAERYGRFWDLQVSLVY
jgi:hypothetical protein